MNSGYTIPGTDHSYERVEARDPEEHCVYEHPSGRYRIVWEGDSFRAEAIVPLARMETMRQCDEIIEGALALDEERDALLDLAAG